MENKKEKREKKKGKETKENNNYPKSQDKHLDKYLLDVLNTYGSSSKLFDIELINKTL